jgi:hypothetical protein
MSIVVNNINDPSEADAPCKCGSWLKHWENFSGKKAGLCVEHNCTEKAEVGAHVQKTNSTSAKWYIIPLCKNHNNQRGETILVENDTIFVSANKEETCEKPNSK